MRLITEYLWATKQSVVGKHVVVVTVITSPKITVAPYSRVFWLNFQSVLKSWGVSYN